MWEHDWTLKLGFFPIMAHCSGEMVAGTLRPQANFWDPDCQ